MGILPHKVCNCHRYNQAVAKRVYVSQEFSPSVSDDNHLSLRLALII